MSLDWSTDELIYIRIDMLAEDLTMRTFNKALQYYAKDPSLKEVMEGFEWRTVGDAKVCALCSGREGKTWRPWQFMPDLPAHIGCRCSFEAVLTKIP